MTNEMEGVFYWDNSTRSLDDAGHGGVLTEGQTRGLVGYSPMAPCGVIEEKDCRRVGRVESLACATCDVAEVACGEEQKS